MWSFVGGLQIVNGLRFQLCNNYYQLIVGLMQMEREFLAHNLMRIENQIQRSKR